MNAERRKKHGITEKGRRCTICHKFKPWDEFYLSNTGVEGRRAVCKECEKKRALRRYEKNLEYHKAHGRRKSKKRRYRGKILWTDKGRHCSNCGDFKTWDEFSVSKAGLQGHQNICKPCAKEIYQEWLNRPGNRRKRQLVQKDYRESLKNPLPSRESAVE